MENSQILESIRTLEIALNEYVSEREVKVSELSSLDEKIKAVNKSLDTLRAVFTKDSKLDNLNYRGVEHHLRLAFSKTERVPWQELALRFLTKTPRTRYTSAEILRGINMVSHDPEERKRIGIYLSQALTRLKEKKLIKIDENKGGRGFLYYCEMNMNEFA